MSSRRRAPPNQPTGNQGETHPAQGDTQTQEPVPRLPHERDESADSQENSEPSAQRVGQAAGADARRGSVDTDKGPVLDRTYERVKKSGP